MALPLGLCGHVAAWSRERMSSITHLSRVRWSLITSSWPSTARCATDLAWTRWDVRPQNCSGSAVRLMDSLDRWWQHSFLSGITAFGRSQNATYESETTHCWPQILVCWLRLPTIRRSALVLMTEQLPELHFCLFPQAKQVKGLLKYCCACNAFCTL